MSDIIQCSCGQKMRLPANSQGKVFKCVKCGVFIHLEAEPAPPKESAESAGQASPAITINALADLFITMNLITQEQAQTAFSQRFDENEKFFQTLLRLEIVTKERLHQALSREPGIAAINLAHFNIDRHLMELLPVEVVLQHWALPIDQLGRSITVAMVCPVDMEAVAAIENLTGRRVRPMLCAMDDFLAAVNKHYRLPDEEFSGESSGGAVAEKTDKQEAQASSILVYGDKVKILERIGVMEVFAIPARVMNQIDAVVGNDGASVRQVVAVAGSSPPFAANVLGTVNSAGYGLPGGVDNLPMAVALLGEQAVALLAAEAPKLPAASERLWNGLNRFSRHCAEISATIATESGHAVPNIAYCAALLHSVGSYALGMMDAEEYHKIDPRLNGDKRLRAEEKIFGVGHDKVGELLAQQWNFPEVIIATIGNYMLPENAGEYRDIASVVWIAVSLATGEGEINSEGVGACSQALEFLHIRPDKLLTLLSAMKNETEKANVGQENTQGTAVKFY